MYASQLCRAGWPITALPLYSNKDDSAKGVTVAEPHLRRLLLPGTPLAPIS